MLIFIMLVLNNRNECRINYCAMINYERAQLNTFIIIITECVQYNYLYALVSFISTIVTKL